MEHLDLLYEGRSLNIRIDTLNKVLQPPAGVEEADHISQIYNSIFIFKEESNGAE